MGTHTSNPAFRRPVGWEVSFFAVAVLDASWPPRPLKRGQERVERSREIERERERRARSTDREKSDPESEFTSTHGDTLLPRTLYEVTHEMALTIHTIACWFITLTCTFPPSCPFLSFLSGLSVRDGPTALLLWRGGDVGDGVLVCGWWV
jgi:hypothetical protein